MSDNVTSIRGDCVIIPGEPDPYGLKILELHRDFFAHATFGNELVGGIERTKLLILGKMEEQ